MIKAVFYTFIFCFIFLAANAQSNSEIIDLCPNWKFSEAHQDNWQKAVVPGSIHQDLLRLNQLPDPFYGMNEQKIQWVEDRDWEYRTHFNLTPEQLKYQGALLEFEGLDTYADVYLNGSLILQADNMFRGYRIPVKNILKTGKNRLYIYFYSPIRKALPQWASNGFDYPADNDHHEQHTSVFTRKAPYHYGWDWGIRMAGCGIWRPIHLKLFNQADIIDYQVYQSEISREKAQVRHQLEIQSISSDTISAQIVFTCSLNNTPIATKVFNTTLHPGVNPISHEMTVKCPQLWMPNGWGTPTLYDIKAEIRTSGNQLIDSAVHRIGFRNLHIVNKEDEHGKSFYVEINGSPLFAKGANYIPNDIILTQVSKADYKRLFRDIKAANMNMIRIWGGGVYEDDYFYQLADENGILIWQDFMFSCTSYPADPSFLKSVEAEADYNIRRLRNHPSLALWCGNNEVSEALKYWGWNKKFSKEHYQQMFSDYHKLFHQLLPEKVKQLDSGRFYIHTSPDSANWGRPALLGWGDSHYWGVWYGVQPFEILDNRIPRFMSEFGFQAFPEMKTISSFAAPEDYALESDVMKSHQKSSTGNHIIRTYMEMYYHIPEKFEDFVYVGLVLQGQGIRHGIEAHRRNRPYCMGSLYWQLNDSWPVVSWSGIDYYGNWKALHYQAQKAFAPILVNAIEEKGNLNYYLISDELISRSDLTLTSQLIDFNGKTIKQKSKKVDLPANTSSCVWQQDSASVVTPGQRKNCFLLLTLRDSKRNILNRQVHYFDHPKNLNLPETSIRKKIKYNDGHYEITLSASQLAKDVFIEIPVQGASFSDNFFDLLPGETRKIIISSPLLMKDNPFPVKVKHLRQTY